MSSLFPDTKTCVLWMSPFVAESHYMTTRYIGLFQQHLVSAQPGCCTLLSAFDLIIHWQNSQDTFCRCLCATLLSTRACKPQPLSTPAASGSRDLESSAPCKKLQPVNQIPCVPVAFQWPGRPLEFAWQAAASCPVLMKSNQLWF